MPTDTVAALDQPAKRRSIHIVAGVLIGLALLLPVQAVSAPAVEASASTNNCSGWTSTSRPPSTIRVLRVQSGRIERIDFRKYVTTVMGKEWPSYLPQAVVEAGAVAVKQYAWYHALGKPRQTKNGQCFDVRDSTGDQLYKPNRARVRPDHHSAVAATWGVTLRKNGEFFMTGYRRGSRARCGADSTGYKLFALSAKRCANKGYNFRQILRTYYGPGFELVEGSSAGSPVSAAQAPSAQSPAAEPLTQPATPAVDPQPAQQTPSEPRMFAFPTGRSPSARRRLKRVRAARSKLVAPNH